MTRPSNPLLIALDHRVDLEIAFSQRSTAKATGHSLNLSDLSGSWSEIHGALDTVTLNPGQRYKMVMRE